MKATHVLVINHNRLNLTLACIGDLLEQDRFCDITVVNNGCTEDQCFDSMEHYGTYIGRTIDNKENLGVNQVWNWFFQNTQNPYLTFLNNDTRLSLNFISSTEELFEKESIVKIINHVTNNSLYQRYYDRLNYVVSDTFRQGWDFSIRKECYTEIPEDMKLFFGDDFTYANVYRAGGKTALLLNSPLIHYCQQTACPDRALYDRQDRQAFLKTGLTKYPVDWKYTELRPTFESLKNSEIKEELYILIPTCKEFEQVKPLIDTIEKFTVTPHTLIATCLPLSAAANRNVALKAIGKENALIITLDDDIGIESFHTGWEQDLVRPILDNPNIIVSARLINADGTPALNCSENYDMSLQYIEIQPKVQSIMPSACIAFRDKGIRFDEAFIGSGFEDTAFLFEYLRQHNTKFYINNFCKLIHLNEMKAQKDYYAQNQKYFVATYTDALREQRVIEQRNQRRRSRRPR